MIHAAMLDEEPQS